MDDSDDIKHEVFWLMALQHVPGIYAVWTEPVQERRCHLVRVSDQFDGMYWVQESRLPQGPVSLETACWWLLNYFVANPDYAEGPWRLVESDDFKHQCLEGRVEIVQFSVVWRRRRPSAQLFPVKFRTGTVDQTVLMEARNHD